MAQWLVYFDFIFVLGGDDVKWDIHAVLWSHASIRLMDIRYVTLDRGAASFAYTLPASGFVYVAGGRAVVRLGADVCAAGQHHLLHGGKGTRLEIAPQGERFAYYLILYRAEPAPQLGGHVRRLFEDARPFDALYACSLSRASLLQGHLADMLVHWRQASTLDKLRVKSTFYQFVYELISMLNEREAAEDKPDLAQLAVRYLQEHYREPVTMDELAGVFNCSVTHLSRLFKRQTGVSPIHYLIQMRMQHAKQWLHGSTASLKDIAGKVGYPDVFYFSRMFKKHTGYSPLQYRKQPLTDAPVASNEPYSPLNKVVFDMEQCFSSLHTDNDNHYQYNKGENRAMNMQGKPSSMAMTTLLCLTLLLSACQASNNQAATGEQPTTRMYKHIDGETEIPAEPKRVFTDLKVGQLMALGVRPIGSAHWALQTGFMDTSGIEDLGKFPLSLEKLAEIEPDLIILTEAWRDGGGYEAFSKIAPTIVIPNHAESLQDELRMFGDIVNKQAEAERWIADFEAKVAAAKEQVQAVIGADETFSILNVRVDQFYIYDDTNMGGNVIYKFLGLKPAEKVAAEVIDGEVWEISAEVIPEYIGDHLFIATNKGAEEALENSKSIWANTNAVKNGKVYELDFDRFLLSDPISVSNHLDIITELLLEKNP